ncbi:transcription initiation factor TFIID subunit 7 [Castilleja foliolosa]|uniref:Transcription initiation factor TFIID subunit 7 n=1 Tax=Castilleja foliolosa TaxID=1961234 RepID=A0ABD3ENH2_9LAMI
MEEQFILRVPPAVAERIERLLNDPASSSEDKSLDLSFSDDGRTGTFVIGNDHFSASLLDLPTVVESYKTYDDTVLIKNADIGQMIMVRDEDDSLPEAVEYRHGLTPPMRDARKRRFRRELDLNPEVVSRVEKDLQNIMTGGTAGNFDILLSCYSLVFQNSLTCERRVEMAEPEYGDESARNAGKKVVSTPLAKPDVPETGTVGGEPDGSDSDESDDSM